jgi:hypothetical protein
MNNSKKILKEYIKLVLEQTADAPQDSLFGKYLFAPHRKDIRGVDDVEENTYFENEFFKALSGHYEGSRKATKDLENQMAGLFLLKNAGKYKKFLEPSAKSVYRILHLFDDLKNYGFNEEDIEKGGLIKSSGGTLKPLDTQVQSWTIQITDELVENIAPGNLHPGAALVIFKANPSSGNFLLNPMNIAKFVKFDEPAVNRFVADEKEVLSYGPVKFDSAVAYIVPSDSKESVSSDEFLGDLLKMAK